MTPEHPITPPPASRPVTLATVGEDFYRNSPIARAAVLAAISEAELIRYLLEHERRLTELATDALHRAAPRTLMVPPKHHGLGYEVGAMLVGKLLATMRPKPPSLAEEALAEINLIEGAMYSADLGCDFTATRAALERLQELENNG